jgi:hypothetical protein
MLQAVETVETAKPVAAKPVAAKPVAAKPVAAKPVAAKPVAAKPVAAKPVAAKPVAAKPVAAKPVAAKPVAASFKLTDRITLPTIITREDAKELARNLWASDASAFSGVSTVATNDNLASKVISLALTKLVFGEHSRLDRVEKYASTLPDYKKTKSGEIAGPIGKRIAILREAVTIGAAIRSTITNIDITSTFNLAELFGASQVLGGMLLPPPPRKVAREAPTLAAARKESLERLESEKRTKDATEAEELRLQQIKEKAEQERIAAEQAAMTPLQRKAAAAKLPSKLNRPGLLPSKLQQQQKLLLPKKKGLLPNFGRKEKPLLQKSMLSAAWPPN